MNAPKAVFALATAMLAVSPPLALMHMWEKLRPSAPAAANTGDEEEEGTPTNTGSLDLSGSSKTGHRISTEAV
ncbi:hypothetical protein ColLi_05082 [Colletotrichum liriopes]|uniref:Uncharacterized protein n=1 Tax=Colletotrichum liriopes TaxID=708192 RepID=A0AA37GJM9_9PEZI|nr:hypothetical protein ColLi_05082 [Colletotrichum liriopes]